ncbi:ComEC/Rec2 family competence protein [Gordonia sp. CPCC 205515]|uniref:ComEC/Rec2 family competence protein n=1 Tax=Gordonia sp. CPCC 205515 TaxID=3140791 RepID=UPI003AF3DDAD
MSTRSALAAFVPSGDYRLVAPAVTVWVVTVVGVLAPGVIVAVAAISGAVLVGAVVVVWRGVVTWSTVAVGMVVAAMAVIAACGLVLRLDTRARHPLSHIDGKARAVLVVRDDPVAMEPAASARVRVRVDVGAVAGRPCAAASAMLSGPAAQWSELLPGQRVSALVRVGPPRRGELLVARLTAADAPHLLGRPPPQQRLAGAVRDRLQEVSARALGPDAAGLLPGLVLGDVSTLDRGVRDDFRAAGLSHLTAVSGANFSLVVGAVVLGVRMLGASPRLTALLGAVVLIGFVILVRPSPSVLRAAMMGMIGLLALVGARRSVALPALGGATIVGLLWWPELAVAPGFALSVLATTGLVLWSAGLRDWLRGKRIPAGLAELTAMALAAQLVTAPVVAMLSGRFSVVGLLANILVVPVVGVIGIVGTAAAVIASIGGADGTGAAVGVLMLRALGPEMWWMIGCARVLGGASWASVPVPGGAIGAVVVGVCTIVVVGLVWQHGRRDGTSAPPARRRRLLDRSGDLGGRRGTVDVDGHRRAGHPGPRG